MEKQVNHGQQLIKENNEKLLFKLVREHTSLSRADLKRLTGLSPTTVSSLADELIAYVKDMNYLTGNTTGIFTGYMCLRFV